MKFKISPFPHLVRYKDLAGTKNGSASMISITLDQERGKHHVYVHELVHVLQWYLTTILLGSLFFVASWAYYETTRFWPLAFALGSSVMPLLYLFSESFKRQAEAMCFGVASNFYSDDLGTNEEYLRHVAKYMADGYDIDKYHWTDTFARMQMWRRKLKGVGEWLSSSIR